jgi:PTS system beta-glucosides-specific IIC component
METAGEGPLKKPGRFRRGVDVVLDFIAGCVSPVIPVLLASGLIAAVLSICVNFFGMDVGSGTAVVLSAVKDAGFYFLPIFLGFSTGNKLGINGYLGALLGGVLVYSTINGAQGLSFLGMSIYPTTYNSTVIPVILGVLFEAVVYKLLNKALPGTVKPFLLPLLSVLVAVPVTLLFLGPLGTVLSGWLTDGVMWVSDTFGAWAVGLYAMINPVCVMFGLDKAITPPILTSIAVTRRCSCQEVLLPTRRWAVQHWLYGAKAGTQSSKIRRARRAPLRFWVSRNRHCSECVCHTSAHWRRQCWAAASEVCLAGLYN